MVFMNAVPVQNCISVSLSRISGSINGMPTLLWFRRDLRLHDLPPLLDAAAADGEVLACYVLDPRLKASSGPRRLQYLYDALRDLRDASTAGCW